MFSSSPTERSYIYWVPVPHHQGYTPGWVYAGHTPNIAACLENEPSQCFTFHYQSSTLLPANMAEPNRLSKEFSGALRTFAYFMASGTHCDLKGVEYLDLYGEEPSAIEMVFAIFANVLELDEEGKPTNSRYAQKRACAYLHSYVNGTEVNPPYEDWETELY